MGKHLENKSTFIMGNLLFKKRSGLLNGYLNIFNLFLLSIFIIYISV